MVAKAPAALSVINATKNVETAKKTVQRFSLKPAADYSFRFRFIEVKQEVKKISTALQSASKLQSDTNIL